MGTEGNGISAMDAEKPLDPVQCRIGRVGIGLSQGALARAIGASERTIYGYEKGERVGLPTALAIRQVLEARGCRFWEGGGEIGVTVPRSAG